MIESIAKFVGKIIDWIVWFLGLVAVLIVIIAGIVTPLGVVFAIIWLAKGSTTPFLIKFFTIAIPVFWIVVVLPIYVNKDKIKSKLNEWIDS